MGVQLRVAGAGRGWHWAHLALCILPPSTFVPRSHFFEVSRCTTGHLILRESSWLYTVKLTVSRLRCLGMGGSSFDGTKNKCTNQKVN